MPFDELPSFLRLLEKNNLLKTISVEVDPELEITEIVNRLYQYSSNSSAPHAVCDDVPALLFEKVKGSNFPLLINLLGAEKNIEILLGETPENIGNKIAGTFSELQSALQRKKIFSWLWKQREFLWKAKSAGTVQLASAPLKEIKKTGSAINLHEFPIMKCWPMDAGKFITAGLVLTKSPNSGIRNLGIYRLQVLSLNELILHWQIQKGGGFHYAEAEELGKPLEVAVVIGADPMLWLAGILPLPEGADEISLTAFLRGAPVPMVRCESIGLDVPASAEIVIEGIARPGRRALEGPFGDHFGHYSHPAHFPVLEVQCITHKKNAIYHAAVVGKPPQEDKVMGETVSKIFLPIIKLAKPELVDLWAYYQAGFHNLLVISVRQRYAKEGLKTALGLLGEGQLSLSKCVMLVDADVNVRDFYSILKAIRQNFNPEKDFILLPGTAQDTLDFTGPKINLGSKMILDATSEGSREFKVQSLEITPEEAAAQAIKHLDQRILRWRILEKTMLVVEVKSHGREILMRLIHTPELQSYKMIAVVSEDVPLENDALLLWGIFTRFDCERDIFFSNSVLHGVRAVHQGVLGIDATWKEGYPAAIEMSPQIEEQVKARWQTYGLSLHATAQESN